MNIVTDQHLLQNFLLFKCTDDNRTPKQEVLVMVHSVKETHITCAAVRCWLH